MNDMTEANNAPWTPPIPSIRGQANKGIQEANVLIKTGNDLIVASGIKAPARFTHVRDGLAAIVEEDAHQGKAALEALRVGLEAGKTDAIPNLFSAAVSATAPADAVMASVFVGVARDLLIPALQEVALAAHAKSADSFNALAVKFVELTNAVDVELPAEAAMVLGEKARKAWLAAPELVPELDRLAGVLYAADLNAPKGASALPGWAFMGEQHVLGDSDVALILTTDTTQLTAEVVDAWKSSGRTGRWGAVVAGGRALAARDHSTIWSSWQMPAWATENKEN